MEPTELGLVDGRRFKAELPNDIWQSEVMHDPSIVAQSKNRKTYTHILLFSSACKACLLNYFRYVRS